MKERHWSNQATKDHPEEEITKNLHGRFCINSYFIKCVAQNLINLMEVTGKMIKDAFEADLLSLKPVRTQIQEPSKLPLF